VRLILASTSPRRRELLARLGLAFEIVAPNYEEVFDPHEPAEEQTLRLALGKARSATQPDAVVIGSDTAVVVDHTILGKPVDRADAQRMLALLQGRSHRVVTAIAVLGPGASDETIVDTAEVRMRAANPDEIRAYVETGEPMDKAGAYAAQGEGAKFIESIQGDPTTVIGLPLQKLAAVLRKVGLPVRPTGPACGDQ
jgi:septum formation protein